MENRAEYIGAQCPNCICERHLLGRHGSPSKVEDFETLHSVVLNIDEAMSSGALMYQFISQSQKKGMSVLRESASDDEFRTIIRQRLSKPDRMLRGFVTFKCSEVRQLRADESANGFNKGDRLYYVLDTDLKGLPHHADVFATVSPSTTPAMRRQQRGRMMQLLAGRMQVHNEFRVGVFSEFAQAQEAPGPESGSV